MDVRRDVKQTRQWTRPFDDVRQPAAASSSSKKKRNEIPAPSGTGAFRPRPPNLSSHPPIWRLFLLA